MKQLVVCLGFPSASRLSSREFRQEVEISVLPVLEIFDLTYLFLVALRPSTRLGALEWVHNRIVITLDWS